MDRTIHSNYSNATIKQTRNEYLPLFVYNMMYNKQLGQYT